MIFGKIILAIMILMLPLWAINEEAKAMRLVEECEEMEEDSDDFLFY